MSMHSYMYSGQRLAMGVIPQELFTLFFYFVCVCLFETVLLWVQDGPELIYGLGWL